MRPGRIKLGDTPFRYTLKSAREAVSGFNRIASGISGQLVRFTAADIAKEDTGPLYRGDIDACRLFVWKGLEHADNRFSEDDAEEMLDEYIRPKARGGKGGGLVDFYIPIRDALVECGVIEIRATSFNDARDDRETADPTRAVRSVE